MKKIAVLFILLLTITGCMLWKESTEENMNDTYKNACSPTYNNSSDRETALKVLDFDAKIITLEEAEKNLKYTGAFFFSLEDCPWCYDALKVLGEVCDKYDVETFYVHMQKEEMTEENPIYKNVKEFLNISDEMFVPYFVVVEKGEVLGYNVGTVKQHVEKNGVVPEMSKQQIEALKMIYDSLYKKFTLFKHAELPVVNEGDYSVTLKQGSEKGDMMYVEFNSDYSDDEYYFKIYLKDDIEHVTGTYSNSYFLENETTQKIAIAKEGEPSPESTYKNGKYYIIPSNIKCTIHDDENFLIKDGTIVQIMAFNYKTNEVVESNAIKFHE